jgi:hypothetical protein
MDAGLFNVHTARASTCVHMQCTVCVRSRRLRLRVSCANSHIVFARTCCACDCSLAACICSKCVCNFTHGALGVHGHRACPGCACMVGCSTCNAHHVRHWVHDCCTPASLCQQRSLVACTQLHATCLERSLVRVCCRTRSTHSVKLLSLVCVCSACVCSCMLFAFEVVIGNSTAIINTPAFYKLSEEPSHDNAKHDCIRNDSIHTV